MQTLALLHVIYFLQDTRSRERSPPQHNFCDKLWVHDARRTRRALVAWLVHTHATNTTNENGIKTGARA